MPNQSSNFTPEQIAEILDLFFENMAHRQYIGARYVPIFGRKDETSIIWDGGADTYEPLTIVLYQGNSYTSRQFVPAGIDITNNEFWAETGNYNAQVEQYRQEVLGYSARIDDVENDLEEFETDIGVQMGTLSNSLTEMVQSETTNREQADANLQTQIDNINTGLTKNKTITVEDYGATGDGVTDSTAAIQQAIAENPNCIVDFKGGTYIITDTIHCWGNRGGQVLDLGGSLLIWQGSNLTNEMFSIDRTDRLVEGDYLYPYYREYNPQESECRFMNGTIRAGGCGIFARAFHTMIDNVKILDATQAAIKIGDPTDHISTQCKITDVMIMRTANYAENWSEQASALNVSLDDVACGIEVYDPDNNFSDINVNRYSVCVRIHNGGQTFENCHFTEQYKERRAALANTAAVVFTLDNPNSVYTNIFDTCYFDNPKYCLWSNTAIRHVVLVSDGTYFNSGNQVSTTTQMFEAYMSKNVNEIKVDNFNVVPADGRCVFIPAKMLIVGSNYQGLSLTQERYVQNLYNGTEAAHRFWSANQNFDDGEYVNVLRSANNLDSGDNQCIGCIAMPGTSIGRFNDVEITISDRGFLYYKGWIHYNGSTLVFIDQVTRGTSLGRYSLYIGQAREISVDGNAVTIWPLYIHANQAFGSTPILMSLDTNNSNMLGFLNAGALRDFNYDHGTWVAQKNFTS